jgi:hypothetical protein
MVIWQEEIFLLSFIGQQTAFDCIFINRGKSGKYQCIFQPKDLA